jgi:hypothetical protein
MPGPFVKALGGVGGAGDGGHPLHFSILAQIAGEGQEMCYSLIINIIISRINFHAFLVPPSRNTL